MNANPVQARFLEYFEGSRKALESLQNTNFLENFDRAVSVCVNSISSGHRIFTAGNGGSFADALHIAGELVNYFTIPHPGMPVMTLGTNGAVLTSWANDHDFQDQLSRELSAFARPGDSLICITTSGKSENIHRLISKAIELSITTIALTSAHGARNLPEVEVKLITDSPSTPHIQEGHIVIYHALCKEIEFQLAPKG